MPPDGTPRAVLGLLCVEALLVEKREQLEGLPAAARAVDGPLAARPAQDNNPHGASRPPIDVHPSLQILHSGDDRAVRITDGSSGSVDDHDIGDCLNGGIAPSANRAVDPQHGNEEQHGTGRKGDVHDLLRASLTCHPRYGVTHQGQQCQDRRA